MGSKDRKRSKSKDRSSRKTSEAPSPPKEVNIPPPTVVAPVKLAAPMQPGAEVQASTKPGMEGVQETAGKIAVERKLQDEGEQVYNTLKQQEEMRISGKSARQMVMQKLMGARGEVRAKRTVLCCFSKTWLVLMRLMRNSMMRSSRSVESMERWRTLSSIRRNKMTLMTLRCMSKFLLSSTRVLRRKRPRMAWMEDFLVVEQCLL